jgi:hypothetical protein
MRARVHRGQEVPRKVYIRPCSYWASRVVAVRKTGRVAVLVAVALAVAAGIPLVAWALDGSSTPPFPAPGRTETLPVSQLPPAPTPTTVPPAGPVAPSGNVSQGSITIHNQRHEPPPPATVSATPCAGADLTGSLKSLGPYQGMGSGQYVISITSTVSCAVEGYPTLQFSSSNGVISSTVTDGGTTGNANPESVVGVGPGLSASFLMQFSIGPVSCPEASSLAFGLPNSAATSPVQLNTHTAAYWPACSSTIVSPFEQGDSPDQYA